MIQGKNELQLHAVKFRNLVSSLVNSSTNKSKDDQGIPSFIIIRIAIIIIGPVRRINSLVTRWLVGLVTRWLGDSVDLDLLQKPPQVLWVPQGNIYRRIVLSRCRENELVNKKKNNFYGAPTDLSSLFKFCR